MEYNLLLMNPKYRYLYLILGAAGLFLLFYQIIDNFPDVDPIRILVISVPDLLLFFLAYKTYPPEPVTKRQQNYQHRRASNY